MAYISVVFGVSLMSNTEGWVNCTFELDSCSSVVSVSKLNIKCYAWPSNPTAPNVRKIGLQLRYIELCVRGLGRLPARLNNPHPSGPVDGQGNVSSAWSVTDLLDVMIPNKCANSK